MSSGSGAGAPPASGMVRSSALSFVASAQPPTTVDCVPGNSQDVDKDEQIALADRLVPQVPAGLKALCDVCSRLYPDQPNPLQVTTRLKYCSGAGAPPASGMVRSSALSFVASAQPPTTVDCVPGNSQDVDKDEQIALADRLVPQVPAGLKALCDVCSRLYPDQPNPLQVTTRLKYWLGGHDPLDYISMYWNPGKPEEHILPHWHYISFGLSDLHGDGRVHPPPDPSPGAASGYGFELTLRLSAEGVSQPPLWPAALLQALARYVFTTGNKLCAGDHISWHRALDGGAGRLRHLLVAADPQLADTQTPHGSVSFLQMVGCTGRELKAAQRGSGFEVLKLISEDPNCGGAWLVTRVSRRTSARGVRGASRRGAAAQLAGVSARLRWHAVHTQTPSDDQPASPSSLLPSVEQQIKETLQRGLNTMTADRSGPEGHMSTDSFEMSSMERALPQIPELMEGSWRGENSVEYLDGVHIILNAEGASLLPLAIDGRVSHGSHFTWRECGRAVTLLPPSVSGAAATLSRPYAVQGTWLQVIIPKDLAADMSVKVAPLSKLADTDSEPDSQDESDQKEAPLLPATFNWPKHRLKITVLSDNEFL